MAITTVGFGTHVGRKRSVNEDSYIAGRQVWAVADGMGGHAAGDVASAIAVARLAELDEGGPIEPSRVGVCIRQANADVLQHGRENPEAWGLGTTVSGICEVIVTDDVPHWAIFNVGDSRVYRLSDGALARATVDHSETEEMIQDGRLTEREARTHYLRNVITRSVGGSTPPQIDMWVLPQTSGERFLVCSDGLPSELEDNQIADILNQCPDPQHAVDALITQVLDAGARDNVTVIVLDVAERAS